MIEIVVLTCVISLGVLALNEFCFRAVSHSAWTRYAIVVCDAGACGAALLSLAFARGVHAAFAILVLVLALTPFAHFVVALVARSAAANASRQEKGGIG